MKIDEKENENFKIFQKVLRELEKNKFTNHLDVLNVSFLKRKKISKERIDWLLYDNRNYYIYSHDFAKALWGLDYLKKLREMIVYENPIDYFRKII